MKQLTIHETELDAVLLIEAPTDFHDFRGEYVELYNRDLYHQAGIAVDFRQDDISVSSRHVLRGLHGDQRTTKLISCLFGKFYLVVVNNDPASPQYRKWTAVTLSDRNRLSALVPPKHANGHLVMSEMAIFHYKQDTVYDRAGQFTLLWNDPDLAIWWPVRDPVVSRRDAGLE